MSVNVAAGYAVVDGSDSPGPQGSYIVYNDASANKTIAASDPTNPRNDIVWARISDKEYFGGGSDTWTLGVTTGTPAASPVDPTLPTNVFRLARVRVDALATSIVTAKITDLRDVGVMLSPLATDIKPPVVAASAGVATRAAAADHVHGSSPYHAEVYQNVAQTVVSGTTTKVTLDTVESGGNPNGDFNVSTSTYTCPIAGRYNAKWNCTFASPVGQFSQSMVQKNGVEYKRGLECGSGGTVYTLPGAATLRCAAGDLLTINVFQFTGGSIALAAGVFMTYASFEWVGS